MDIDQELIILTTQAVKKHILSTKELSDLRVKGPIIAGYQLSPIINQYAALFQLNKEEQQELYCACVVAEFWDDIPAE